MEGRGVLLGLLALMEGSPFVLAGRAEQLSQLLG